MDPQLAGCSNAFIKALRVFTQFAQGLLTCSLRSAVIIDCRYRSACNALAAKRLTASSTSLRAYSSQRCISPPMNRVWTRSTELPQCGFDINADPHIRAPFSQQVFAHAFKNDRSLSITKQQVAP